MRSARRARRRFDAGGALDGVAEGGGVGEAGIAGNALGQPDAMGDGQALEQLFDALVDVEHPQSAGRAPVRRPR